MKAKDDTLLRRSALFRFLPDEHFEKILPLLQEEEYESVSYTHLTLPTN